jgi:SAM-dependent methyltransferase
MPYLRGLERAWESLAQDDSMWAICTDPTRRGRRWEISEFLATGETEISTVLSHISDLGVRVDFSGIALDFGCGMGRLTQALGRRFAKCIGVDISTTMIDKGASLNPAPEKCELRVNRSPSLEIFDNESFSFVYSNIVLQHVSPRYAERYIQEFVRVLRPGGVLVFQTADSIRGPLWARLKARILRPSGVLVFQTADSIRGLLLARLRAGMRIRAGLMSLFHTAPPAMHFFPEAQVRRLLGGVRLVEVAFTNACQRNFNGRLAFAEQEPREGYVSKSYVIVKDRD